MPRVIPKIHLIGAIYTYYILKNKTEVMNIKHIYYKGATVYFKSTFLKVKQSSNIQEE